MEEVVAGAAIGATIKVLLQNLLPFSVEEIGLLVGFKKDLQKLKDSLVMVQDFLSDAEEKQITNKAVKRWLKNLEDVAFDADNLLDELNYQLLRQKVKNPQINMKKRVKSFISGTNSLTFRFRIGHKIRDIVQRLEIINKEATSYGLQNVIVGSNPGLVSLVERQTDSFQKDPVFLGRENDLSNLVEMINSCPMEKAFSIIPIVGMGGLGKTSLARLLLKDERIDKIFQKKIWACVSDQFDAKKLFKMILESSTAQSVEVGTREAVLKKLQIHLQGERFLLVLDDIWNEEIDKWGDFINSLSGIASVNGNCIIVTTRSEKVASIVKTLPAYKLSSLSEDNCWSIIKERSFEGGEVPEELHTIGKRIAKRCQGLPLVANIIGGLLFDRSKGEWLSILENGSFDFGENENKLMHVLKLSYDHLPSPSLKKCFAYCSIFSKDYRINKSKLIGLWMSQGFLQSNHENDDMEIVGNRYVNYLLLSSLFQDVEKDGYDNITYFKMHDYVHDLACSISNSETIGVHDIASTSHEIHRVRHLAVKLVGDEGSAISKEQARHLRTFFFCGKLYVNTFLEFQCLHTLSLKARDVIEISNSIEKMIHLRYLDIYCAKIKCLPDSIGKLYNLQTLKIIQRKGIDGLYLTKLPKTIKNLISLRHLVCSSNVELPPGIGKLTCLRTLQSFSVNHGNGCGITELGCLKNLEGELTIYNLERVKNKEVANGANLSQKPNLFKLRFVWNQSLICDGERNEEKVLEGLQPHVNIKDLIIDGFEGKKFPVWTMKMAVIDDQGGIARYLNHLMKIELVNCSTCEEIPMFGHLPHLKFLILQNLPKVTRIGASFYGSEHCRSISNRAGQETITLFPSLKKFQFDNFPNLTDWVEAQVTNDREVVVVVFPCLRELNIFRCPQLESAPSHFPCLEELWIDEIGSVLPLQNICSSENINTLRRLSITNISRMNNLPDDFFVKFVNLSRLGTDVFHDGIQTLSSLRSLILSGSDDQNSLPEKLQYLTAITRLRIFYFGIESLPEWFGNLSALEFVCLYECKKLRHLPSKESMQRITKLDKVRIDDCPLLEDKCIKETLTGLSYIYLESYYN